MSVSKFQFSLDTNKSFETKISNWAEVLLNMLFWLLMLFSDLHLTCPDISCYGLLIITALYFSVEFLFLFITSLFFYLIEHSYNNFYNIVITVLKNYFLLNLNHLRVGLHCFFSRESHIFFWFFKCWLSLDCILNVVNVYVVYSVIFLWRVLICLFVSRHLISLDLNCKLSEAVAQISIQFFYL